RNNKNNNSQPVSEEVVLTVRVDANVCHTGDERKIPFTFFRNLPRFFSPDKDLLLQLDQFCRENGIANDHHAENLILLKTRKDESKWLLRAEDLHSIEEEEEVRLVSGT
ncbi:unnamed protein product, partial [Amoebophrya sp. A120]